MPQLETNGASIHYETAGAGPPLLLIAGIASDGASWRPLIPLLSPHFSLILIDNRGSGRSVAEGTLSIPDMVADCIALLDHLGIAGADVVGHSMGGMIGHRLAAHFPDRVKRLVTITCSDRIGAKERVLFHDMAKLYAGGMAPQAWFRLLFQLLFSEPFFVNESTVAAAAEASAAYPYRQSPANFSRQVDAVDRLQRLDQRLIRCPTLAIAAAGDMLVPPAMVLSGHAGIGKLTTVVIEGASHSVHWEAPERVAQAIVEFLG